MLGGPVPSSSESMNKEPVAVVAPPKIEEKSSDLEMRNEESMAKTFS